MVSLCFLVFVLFFFRNFEFEVSACTAILVSRQAAAENSALTTHNNDCTDCDIRIALIPSVQYDEADDARRCPIYPCRFSFPRFVGSSRGPTYSPSHLTVDSPAAHLESLPIGFIPQVSRTFSYIEGSYPIANEHSLLMGESTCASKFVSYGKPWGEALFDIAALMRVAMERCKTSRCAAELMGQLATDYGYYGANDPPEVGVGLYEESGEAVTLADPDESWVFHVMPDESGKSAIWVAQRLPEGHFTVVANKFIIRTVDLADKQNFLGTPNMREIAVKAGFWPANRTDFDFAMAFAPDAGQTPGWGDRRTWRLFDWVAPGLKLQPNGPEEFPFSVKAEKLLSISDVMAMNRDHFEGTEFDLSHNAAAGPYNNPNRYDRNRKPEYAGGYFERAISLHRTSYSFVAEANSNIGVLWFAHHAPHSSLFIPLPVSIHSLPPSFTVGSLFTLRRSSAWWAFASVSNYAEKMFLFIQRDISRRQHKIEREAHNEIKKMRKIAEVEPNQVDKQFLTNWTVNNAERQVADWWDFFDFLLTKFRDGIVLQNFEAPLTAEAKFYPAWWLGRVGYYDRGPMPPYMPVMAEPNRPAHPDAVGSWGEKLELADAAGIADAELLKHAAMSKLSRSAVPSELFSETEFHDDFDEFQRLRTRISTAPAFRITEIPDIQIPARSSNSYSIHIVSAVLISLVFSLFAFISGSQWQKRRHENFEYATLE